MHQSEYIEPVTVCFMTLRLECMYQSAVILELLSLYLLLFDIFKAFLVHLDFILVFKSVSK